MPGSCLCNCRDLFVLHSREANAAQDLAALGAVRRCPEDEAWDAAGGTGLQGKKLPAVRLGTDRGAPTAGQGFPLRSAGFLQRLCSMYNFLLLF